jgi:hypothetical protein
VLVKKKVIQKKVKVVKESYKTSKHGLVDDHQFDKENSRTINNNNSVKPPTKQEERATLKELKKQDESIKRSMYSVAKKRKKSKGSSSFKFFKTKNASTEESSSSDESEDLVPEIRDFPESKSSPEPKMKVPAKSPRKAYTSILMDETFEDFADTDINGTTFAIESLLMNLDTTEIDTTIPLMKPVEANTTTLESLIETLEGVPAAEKIKTPEKRPTKEAKKVRFMGLGENQMQLDAGQKKFGLVECKECGFSYNVSVFDINELNICYRVICFVD